MSNEPIDIERLKALAQAATPGPWNVITDEHATWAKDYTHKERRIFTVDDVCPVVNRSRGISERKGDAAIDMVSIEANNADYIVAANPAAVLAMIDRIRELEAKLAVADAEATRLAGALVTLMESSQDPILYPFAIVVGRDLGGDRIELAVHDGINYTFSDGDCFDRDGDTLDGFTAEFLTQHELELRLAAAGMADRPQWISVSERPPADETPVIILLNGQARIGELCWESPGYEETYEAFRYWDDPNDDGQGWDWHNITHWMPLPAGPAAMSAAEGVKP